MHFLFFRDNCAKQPVGQGAFTAQPKGSFFVLCVFSGRWEHESTVIAPSCVLDVRPIACMTKSMLWSQKLCDRSWPLWLSWIALWGHPNAHIQLLQLVKLTKLAETSVIIRSPTSLFHFFKGLVFVSFSFCSFFFIYFFLFFGMRFYDFTVALQSLVFARFRPNIG